MVQMKKMALLLLAAMPCMNGSAADLTVQYSGPAGTYASVAAAVTAAAEGDRIFIVNRPDGLPWIEDITINKSLTFLSATDNVKFWVEGQYTVDLANNRKVEFIGMKNTQTATNLTYSGSTAIANRTSITVLGSDLSGAVTLGNGGTNFYMGNSFGKAVTFTFGKIIGNDLRSLTCSSDPVSTEDINLVIGNRLFSTITTGAGSGSVYTHQNNSQYLYFSNNYCNTYTYSSNSCLIAALKAGGTTNKIINSTFEHGPASSSYSYTGYSLASLKITATGSATLDVMNCFMKNALYTTYSSYGVYSVFVTSGAITPMFTYNIYSDEYSSFVYSLSSSLGNSTCGGCDADNSTGANTTGFGTNAGNPLNDFLDLDLTRNDVGCYGGSYSMENFFPVSSGNSSVVNYMTSPRVVPLGGTVNVQLTGFDR